VGGRGGVVNVKGVDMSEWIQILTMILGGGLFAAGGTHIPKFGGQKWIRRFVLPLSLGGIAYSSGIAEWRCLCMALGLIISFHLGYGSATPYWRRVLTAASFTLPTLFLGFSAWQIITPVMFLGMFWLSNNRYWNRIFQWKFCEYLTGSFIAITVAQLIGQTYGL
jgi:hypothetical protein